MDTKITFDKKIISNSMNVGFFSIASEISGHLFMDNVKMEKQRTNLSYQIILKKYGTIKGFWNGLFPWVAIQSFGKGCIVGVTKHLVEEEFKDKNYTDNKKNIILGLSTGIAESLFLTPLLIKRTETNKRFTESSKAKVTFSKNKVLKSFTILTSKRCVDWTFRFIFIDFFSKYSPTDNIYFNTFMGAGFSTIMSTPIDRLIPLINDDKIILKVLRQQGIGFFYKGFIFRFLSTAHYATFVLALPYIFKDKF